MTKNGKENEPIPSRIWTADKYNLKWWLLFPISISVIGANLSELSEKRYSDIYDKFLTSDHIKEEGTINSVGMKKKTVLITDNTGHTKKLSCNMVGIPSCLRRFEKQFPNYYKITYFKYNGTNQIVTMSNSNGEILITEKDSNHRYMILGEQSADNYSITGYILFFALGMMISAMRAFVIYINNLK